MEQCGGCHSPDLRRGHGVTVHLKLKNLGDANRARRGDVSPRQATSEVLVGHKRGAEIDIGESGELPVGANSAITDALDKELFLISGWVREQVLARGRTSRGERTLT